MQKFFRLFITSALVLALVNSSNAQLISVKIQPTPPVYERPPAPSVRHVWVDGEWEWRNNQYVWKPGFWVVPEPYKVWQKGYWKQNPSGTIMWVPGHWRASEQNVAVVTRPAEVVETRPAAPSSRHIWVDGEWVWQNGHYGWKAGFWVLPQAHQKWMRGYWTQRPNGQWYWVAGHWIEY